jgi:UDPglucose 6-dehydrogenase
MRILIVGAGYVGLATAVAMLRRGHEVMVVDCDATRIDDLKQGISPFKEPGLADALGGVIYANEIPPLEVWPVDLAFVCVPADGQDDGSLDTSTVEQVVAQLRGAQPDLPIVIRSTVPPGTSQRLGTIANPEFIREGHVVEDALRPDRIVVGSDSEEALLVMVEAWAPDNRLAQVVLGDDAVDDRLSVRCLVTDTISAELIKLATNGYYAARISYANMVADLCDAWGADRRDVLRGLGLGRYVGEYYLQAGLGFGGSCLPKDARALLAYGDAAGVDVSPVAAALAVNEARIDNTIAQIIVALGGGRLKDRRILILGRSFKPDSSDERGSQGLVLAERLEWLGAEVTAVDADGFTEDLLDETDCIVIAVPKAQFRELDYPEGVPIIDPWQVRT